MTEKFISPCPPPNPYEAEVLYAAVMEMRPEDCLAVRADLPMPTKPGRAYCVCGAEPKKHQLETSFKLLAEKVRSLGYQNHRQESNAELIGRFIWDAELKAIELVSAKARVKAARTFALDKIKERDAALTEIGRLKAIIRVNGLRWGATHAEIDAMLEYGKSGVNNAPAQASGS